MKEHSQATEIGLLRTNLVQRAWDIHELFFMWGAVDGRLTCAIVEKEGKVRSTWQRMKHIIGLTLSIIIGVLVGFFGVIASVFADGGVNERLLTIAAILLIYAILGGIWGLLFSGLSWKWGFLLGGPGVLFLGIFMLGEFDPFYLVYMALILAFACLGAWIGSSIVKRRRT